MPGEERRRLEEGFCCAPRRPSAGSGSFDSHRRTQEQSPIVRTSGGLGTWPRKLGVRKFTGQFPNYEAILPRENNNFAVVPAHDFLGSVQRALEFADERPSAVKLHLAEKMLTVSASVADLGESQESLPLSYNSAPVTIGFNGTYQIDFINTVGSDGELRLALKDTATAAVITQEAFNPEYQQRYVLMPLRV